MEAHVLMEQTATPAPVHLLIMGHTVKMKVIGLCVHIIVLVRLAMKYLY